MLYTARGRQPAEAPPSHGRDLLHGTMRARGQHGRLRGGHAKPGRAQLHCQDGRLGLVHMTGIQPIRRSGGS
jgi:hypothetical protein